MTSCSWRARARSSAFSPSHSTSRSSSPDAKAGTCRCARRCVVSERSWTASTDRKSTRLNSTHPYISPPLPPPAALPLPHPSHVAQQSPGREGRSVPLRETVRGFREILDGKHDDLPEQAFYMVGAIDEAVEQAQRLAAAY